MRRGTWLALLAVGLILIGLGARSLGSAAPPRMHVTALAAEPQHIISDAPFRQAPPLGTSLVGGGTPGQTRGTAPKDERIKFLDLAIDLPVVEGDGYNAPLNKAAHFPGLPWPGQGGRSVLYAHARPGMFAPAMRLDHRFWHDLTPEAIDSIVRERRSGATAAGRTAASAPESGQPPAIRKPRSKRDA